MNRFLLSLIISVLATAYGAAAVGDRFVVEGLTYTVTSEDTGEVSVAKGEVELPADLVIPAKVTLNGQTYSVTSVAEHGFSYCGGLSSVTLPKSVTSIDSGAFQGCSSLTSINLPEGVTSIKKRTFFGCSGLTSIIIPEGITSIGADAFYGCSGLTSIIIPEGVTALGSGVFADCSGLTSITIPEGVTSIGANGFSNCSGLTSITIPDGTTSIGMYCFSGCSGLKSITLSASVTSIGDFAFDKCESLTDIIVEIGNKHYCSENGVLYNSDKTILKRCPEAKEECDILESVTSIDDYAFHSCARLSTVTIPESVTSIGNHAFTSCSSLTEIIVEIGNKHYCSENGVLYNSDKTILKRCPEAKEECDILESVTSIDGFAFHSCSRLSTVTIPERVTSIYDSAFGSCGMTSITIPKGVTYIGPSCFYNCSFLTEITYLADEPIKVYHKIFSDETYANATLYMSEAGAAAGKGIDPWKNFKNVKVSDSSSLNGVVADFNAEEPCEVFTFNGVKVAGNADNLPAGVYIVRQGNTVKKIAVK